jgi:hypothetical protein
MGIVNRWRARLAGALCAVCMIAPAGADTLLDTGTPGGFFGYYGFDVFVGQSVAVGFTPTQNYSFDSASLWLMSNDFQNPGRRLTVSLQADAGGATPTGPSGVALESWSHATSAVGWAPVLETLTSTSHPMLMAGTTYWIVAESNEPAQLNPVWVAAGNGPLYWTANIDFMSSPAWQVGQGSGPAGAIVTATPVPEPAVWLLAAMGMPFVLRLAQRHRSA